MYKSRLSELVSHQQTTLEADEVLGSILHQSGPLPQLKLAYEPELKLLWITIKPEPKPVFTLPLPGGRYRFIYEHPVEPPPADSPDPVREFTQRCTDVLEMYVRRHPELWLWMHRRWRTDG